MTEEYDELLRLAELERMADRRARAEGLWDRLVNAFDDVCIWVFIKLFGRFL